MAPEAKTRKKTAIYLDVAESVSSFPYSGTRQKAFVASPLAASLSLLSLLAVIPWHAQNGRQGLIVLLVCLQAVMPLRASLVGSSTVVILIVKLVIISWIIAQCNSVFSCHMLGYDENTTNSVPIVILLQQKIH